MEVCAERVGDDAKKCTLPVQLFYLLAAVAFGKYPSPPPHPLHYKTEMNLVHRFCARNSECVCVCVCVCVYV